MQELPAIDKRTPLREELSPTKKTALGKLKNTVPGARITFHEKLGTPSWVASPKVFLTGPGGAIKGAQPDAGAQAMPENVPHRPVKAFLSEHRTLYGYGPEILEKARIRRDFTTAHNEVQTTVWEQQVDGIPVYESVLIGHVTANRELINISSSFVPEAEMAGAMVQPDPARAEPWLSVEEAIVLGAGALGVTVFADELMRLDEPLGGEKLQHLAGGSLPGSVRARLTWFPLTAERLVLAWRLELTQPFPNERYRVLIDARTGELLLRRKLTLHYTDAQYRVYTGQSPAPLRPGHAHPSTNQPPFANRTLLTLSALTTNASPLGWLNDHANDTRGNNVHTHLDRNGDDLPDLPRPVGNPARSFDFAMDIQQGPETYQEASVVQLFYWCNWMHDQLYELGFTEAAGNFQKDNLGRGGRDNDPIIADAQDGSGVNNANFTPTEDGESPRIQMFLFDGSNPKRDGSFDAEIVLHEYAHGLSTRLVGGGVGISLLQAAGMGEGWSDFYALALLTQPGEDPDAAYPMSGYATYQFSGLGENYYFGIRRYPYSTDLSKNPLTLKDIDPAQIDPHPSVPLSPIHPFSPIFANEVHYQGEVWCVTLWEARANLIHKHGLEVGNRLILRLVTDGMKLSPPNPTFLEARDAILQADLLNNGGANWLELWKAFAKRGMGFSAYVPTADSTIGVREAFDLPDAMLVLPQRNFFPSGPAGGPFAPECISYVLTNTSTNVMVWSSVNSETWLRLEPAGGPIAPNGSVTVRVCLTAEAARLPIGVYEDTILFRNNATGLTQERGASLRVMGFASMPFQDDFESGNLGPMWQTTGTGIRRTQVTGNNGPKGGKYHVTMDTQEFIESYARNELTLGLDLGGYTNVTLQFWARSFGEEPDGPPPAPFLEGANFDGVAISQDGIKWYEVAGLRGLNTTYQQFKIPLDSIMAEVGLSYSPNFRIRFNQYDNLAIPYDGIGLDDVSVTGVASRRMWVEVPTQAREGEQMLKGTIRLAAAAEKDLTIQLQSSELTKVNLPPVVTIPAGSINASFDLTVVDNPLLDGTRSARISASAEGYYSVPVQMDVEDNERAVLKVTVFPLASEGGGTFKKLAQVTSSRRVDRDIVVQLISSHSGLLVPPAFVVIPAGGKSAEFPIRIVDGSTLDGVQRVTITAHVSNWIDGVDVVSMTDNDRPVLFVSAPVRVSEIDGVLSRAGQVRLAASLKTNLVVRLVSSNPGKLSVDALVQIPAGALFSPFSFEVKDNALAEGAESITLSASASGFTNGFASIQVVDNETPPVPYAPSPAHLATNVAVDTHLSWRAGVGEALVNGGFETGDFTGWTKEDIEYGTFVINDGKRDPEGPDWPMPPYEGKYNAMTEQFGGGIHTLFQDVLIPPDAESATLSWVDRIRNHGTQFDDEAQVFRVEIRDLSNEVLATAFSTKPGDPLTNNWVRREFDLSGYRGEWVRIAFFQEDHLGYFNAHIDQVSVRLGTATNLSFDVYFGTNSVLGAADLAGTTAFTFWKLPRLSLEENYYWRIVSRFGAVSVEGATWQFSSRGVGQLDHYAWSSIDPVQQLGIPFTASLTAKDDIGNTLTNYSGQIFLSGQFGNTNASTVLISEFDTGSQDKVEFVNASPFPVNISGWQIALYDSRYWPAPAVTFTVPTNTVAGVGEVFLVRREGTFPGVYPEFFTGTNINWNNNILGNPVAIALLDNYSNVVDFACAFDADPSLIRRPVPIPAGEWVSNPITANTNLNQTFQRTGHHDVHSRENWSVQVPNPGIVQSNLALPFEPLSRVAVAPQTVVLTNGVWAGPIQIEAVQSNMVLIAEDNEGRRSLSDIFRVGAPQDLSLVVEPSNIVGMWGKNYETVWVVRNDGSGTAQNVRFTNTAPSALAVVSWAATHGSCVIENGTVICTLASIAPGEKARIAITYQAAQPGWGVSSAAVRSDSADAWLTNNTAALTFLVNEPFLSSTNITLNEGSVGTTNGVFSVRLSAPAPAPVSVRYSTLDLSANEGSDYAPTSGTLVFPPGVTNLPVAVPVVGDRLYENLETFFLVLSDATNATIATPSARCRINNDDNFPAVSIRDVTVVESAPGEMTNATFHVILSAPSGLTTFVEYKAADGSAKLDLDYGLAFGTLTFPPGVTNLEVNVPIKGDNIPETNEVFHIQLGFVLNATIAKGSGVGTILDNGLASLDHFQISDVPSPQVVGKGILVTISALDAWERPFTNFSGTVAIQGVSSLKTFLVGTGKVASTNLLGASYHDARTQVIYSTNDLPHAGEITALALQVSIPPGQTLSNWTIRMKHTPASAYLANTSWESSGWSTVYQRHQTFNTPGWVTFYLDTPFAYNGTNNLLLDLSFDNTSYSSDGVVLCTTSAVPRILYGRSDSAFGSPLSWTKQNGAIARLTNQVPNAQFVVETSVPVTPTVVGPFVQGLWTGEVTVWSPSTNLFLRAVDKDGHAGVGNAFTVEGGPGHPPSKILSLLPHEGSFELSFTTGSGAKYVLERTTDLSSGLWTPVGTEVIGSGAVVRVVDRNRPPEGNCFYRVRVVLTE